VGKSSEVNMDSDAMSSGNELRAESGMLLTTLTGHDDGKILHVKIECLVMEREFGNSNIYIIVLRK
jgi:hypothetical protein